MANIIDFTKPVPALLAANDSTLLKKWKIWTPEEIYAELPAIEWLVEGIIPKASVGMLAAYGSSLKSWAELDLLDALAVGRPWLGRFACPKASALLVDYESGSYEIRRRLQRIARARGDAKPVQGLAFASMPPNSITDSAWLGIIEQLASNYQLIAIDTLAAGSSGADENDARFAAPLNALKPIAEKTGCSFIILHHTRKSRDGDDDRETTRGTGAIFNALDFELKLFRTKEDGAFVCRQTKSRLGKAVESFSIRVTDTADGASVVAADDIAGDEDIQAGAKGAALTKAKQKVIALLTNERDLRSANEICRRVGGTKAVVLEAIKELKERNIVTDFGGVFRLTSEVLS